MSAISETEPLGWGATLALLSVARPTPAQVHGVVLAQASGQLTYPDVGATRGPMPHGWSHDASDEVLGRGMATFDRAVHAMRSWSQFDLTWVFPQDRAVPIEEGRLFGFLAHTYGVWSVNVCRIVYVIDERDDRGARFGFAYGTVGAHSVRGEERFLIEWDRETDQVRFEIRKFSKPAIALLRLLGPLTRRVQRRFTVQALDRLHAEVTRA